MTEVYCPECKTTYTNPDKVFSRPIIKDTCRTCGTTMSIDRNTGQVRTISKHKSPLSKEIETLYMESKREKEINFMKSPLLIGLVVLLFLISLAMAILSHEGSFAQILGRILFLFGTMVAVIFGISVFRPSRKCPLCGSFNGLRITGRGFGGKVQLNCSVCDLTIIRSDN